MLDLILMAHLSIYDGKLIFTCYIYMMYKVLPFPITTASYL